MVQRISFIAEQEGVRLGEGALDTILETSGGDMRKAVTFLQSSHQLSGGQPITHEMVVDISGMVRRWGSPPFTPPAKTPHHPIGSCLPNFATPPISPHRFPKT